MLDGRQNKEMGMQSQGHAASSAAHPERHSHVQRCVAVMQVVASSNQKLQELAAQAQQAAASGTSNTASLMALRTSISKLAAVQQQDVMASIGNLAVKYAADPTYDASVDLADFTVVSTLSDLSRKMCRSLSYSSAHGCARLLRQCGLYCVFVADLQRGEHRQAG